MQTLKRLKAIRAGSVWASVWRKDADGRVSYDVSFSCSPRRPTALSAESFSHCHIDSLIDAAIEAQEWIKEKEGTTRIPLLSDSRNSRPPRFVR